MLAADLKSFGVVGAGGAGFPTYVKAQSQAEFLLANGAECEPLLHKDFELMCHFPEPIIRGMQWMARFTGARESKFGIKEKNKEAVTAIQPHAQKAGIPLVLLGDFYPSGDEYELVYSATGRLIPPAGIPLNVGCVVNNVETLHNIALAAEGKPVIRKFVSIAGAVRKPCSFWAPVGMLFSDLLAVAGGPTVDNPAIFVSGIMMGSLAQSLDEPVTKTTCGLIVLPGDHPVAARRSQPATAMARIGKSACDQCSYCTEFCPRYLLGYDVQPHKVMRSLGFTLTGASNWNEFGQLCCACGLCTLYACPEDLFPKEACDQAKIDLKEAGIKFEQSRPVRVHPMKEYRRVPLKMLRQRLKVDHYESETPYIEAKPPSRVRIPFKQHAGQPAIFTSKRGDTVKQGDLIARMSPDALGADVHASIAGTITKVSQHWAEIEG